MSTPSPGSTSTRNARSIASLAPITMLCGGTPVPVDCTLRSDFKLTPEALEEAAAGSNAKVLIMPYPNNPTGAVMTKEDITALLPVIEKYDLSVVSDEIYAELTYDGKHVSPASVSGYRDRTIVINGFSKAFAMTGWRLGYVAAPSDALSAMLKVHQYTALCAPTPSQYAGLAALKDGRYDGYKAVSDMVEEYDRRRRFIVDELNSMGLECRLPGGAFYALAKVSSTGMDGQKFARRLLADEKVAVVPGDAFGDAGKDYIRVSYATSLRTLMQAAERMSRFVVRCAEERKTGAE